MKLIMLLALAGGVILASCGDAKKLQYLQGPFSDTSANTRVSYKEPSILPGDILTITVYSDNAAASALYNQPSTNATATASSPMNTGTNIGYLVDNNGNIQFHSLGNIQAKGLTRQQLGAKVVEKLEPVLKNAYCQVRFSNYKVTVIGEVNNPSVFTVPNEKISVLEAIGLAGDLTSYGRRDSVMIIRETDSTRKFGWIDLKKSDIFNSEFFYLKQNDVIVVHPIKSKSAVNDQIMVRNISLAATVISTLAIIITLIQN